MANNSHGNRNEHNIATALNNKHYKDLTSTLKMFIKDIYPQIYEDTLIISEAKGGTTKNDVMIIINDKNISVSVKEGSGNSVHQEKLEPFIQLLYQEFNIDKETKDAFRFYIWGDYTLDGSGNFEDRMNGTTIKKNYPNIVEQIQLFFNNHAEELLTRFLITGRYNTGHVDYIYYGTAQAGVWAKSEDIIKYHLELINNGMESSSPSIGNLTFQSWNRCIKGRAKEKYRDTIQLKWGNLEKDLAIIQKNKGKNFNRESYEGTLGEFNLARELNRDKNNKHWKILQQNLKLTSLESIYAIKVSNKVLSNLIHKLVLPKTDIYLITSDKITENFIKEHNYALDEQLLQKHNITYKFVSKSGISVKKKESDSYTIHKFSISSFIATFGNTVLAGGASLFCNNAQELYKNKDVLSGWNTSEEELTKFLNITAPKKNWSTNIECIDFITNVKHTCSDIIKYRILNEPIVSNIVFKGDFDEPYTANFIYKFQELQLNMPTDFSVTTGSGRSKGNYTIIIKPKKK